MKRLAIGSAYLALSFGFLCSARGEEPKAEAGSGYKILKEWSVSGTDRWDYISVDAANRRVYIARSTHVTVLDADSGETVGDIANTAGVHGAAIAPEQGHGFTSNGRDNTVTMFDIKTLKTLETIKVGEKPDAIMFDSASGRVFAMNGGSGDATAIDSSSGKVVGTLKLRGTPEFAVGDGKGKIFVNLEDKSEVVEFDAQKLEIIARWPVSPGMTPTGLAIDHEHRRLFSGCRAEIKYPETIASPKREPRLVVLDADSGKVLSSPAIGAGVDATAFDPETGLAFASCGDGTLAIVHEESPGKFTLLDTVKTFKGAKTMTLDTKTHHVLVPALKTSGTDKTGTFVVLVIGK